ncbi:aliphatic sulfonate ABC transporter substrate-binding protein [Thermanaerosceptrum fracticalcis]|uniref:Aliphatic sulfonate ABC transporter substrate-binding protein n=1 Tax=Thermanaerosceptrum fracticalcis TaxID=1712410 RepID=A0A7G6E7T0_THEFR|nr:ABC transporter substrate-binding protein [Thermanaerosceptrum fracticalcis]QNB48134.1 aliphatic sulfonate ABC transporter substrate-binding protein [Thermanaerosceptrum fracticalcis]
MRKFLSVFLLILLILTLVTGCSGSKPAPAPAPQAKEEPKPVKLVITLPTWVGYGPLYLAKEKGFFKEQGLDVELTKIEGLAERKQALAGKKVDGMATAQDVQVTIAAAGIPVKVVWALDDSYGGDGMLAKNEIKDIKDLKGKTVALETGTTSHFFALTVLQKVGLTEKDIKITNMKAGDAGAAFVAGQVDAAVTWEPWLSKGKAKGKVLASTKEYPGIIVDTVSFRADVVENNPKAMEGFVRAMSKAMDYWKQNKQESEEIMAKGLGMEVKDFQAVLPDLKFFDLEGNKKFFGTASSPGLLYETTQKAVDFYASLKVIDTKPKATDIVDSTYVNK